MNKFIGVLFSSRTQAHIAHLQVNSYAAHKALQTYYEDIVGLIDGLVEEYQGKYEIIKDYQLPKVKDMSESQDIISYFEDISKFIEKYRGKLPQDSNIQNSVDTVITLINSTIYKLKFLK